MLTNTLKVIGVVGVVGAGIGGGVTYATSVSKTGPLWKVDLSATDPILSCKGSDGIAYELFLNVGRGGHLKEEFDPKAYKVQGDKKELLTDKDFFYFWLHYNYMGKFYKIVIQSLSDVTSAERKEGTVVQCQGSSNEKIKVERQSGEGKVNLGQMWLRAVENTCKPEGDNVTKKICDLKFLLGENLEWISGFNPKVTYTLISK